MCSMKDKLEITHKIDCGLFKALSRHSYGGTGNPREIIAYVSAETTTRHRPNINTEASHSANTFVF
jgi:hypothetical protein